MKRLFLVFMAISIISLPTGCKKAKEEKTGPAPEPQTAAPAAPAAPAPPAPVK